MNKSGFTLVELIAVLVLIVLVSLLTFPNLSNLMKNNNEKEFTTYESLMVSYAKTFSLNKYVDFETNKGHICYRDLKMKPIRDSVTCNGYVEIDGNNLTPYLSCSQNDNQLYQTDNYLLPGDC